MQLGLFSLAIVVTQRKMKTLFKKSIHRFDGFNIAKKERLIWYGLILEHEIHGEESSEQMLEALFDRMRALDSVEVVIHMTAAECEPAESCLEQFIELGTSAGCLRVTDRSKSSVTAFLLDKSTQLPPAKFGYWKYTFSGLQLKPEPVEVWTREALATSSLSSKAIFSDRIHGVDNTGNVCVWKAESILLHCLLSQAALRELVCGKRVLELGGGSTALAGIGLAAAGLCSAVVVTDGHPDCVRNQKVCIHMSRQGGCIPWGCTLESFHLVWSNDDVNAERSLITSNGSLLFGVIIASDCLFFTDFHEGLLKVLKTTLAPHGTVLLMQPKRGDTMERFLKLAASYFEVVLQEDYCEEISSLRRQYQEAAEAEFYNDDIHFPILAVLQRHSY